MNQLTKLKNAEIKKFREQLLINQGNVCGLCGEPLSSDEAVLDHNHKTGKVRKALHRGCNVMEGVIANNAVRNKINHDRLQKICNNLINYLDTAEIEVLHPTHKTPEEKILHRKKRDQKRRSKKANDPLTK